jgi:hypothetical protein
MKQLSYLLLLDVVITACTSSRITSSWKDSNLQSKKYNKILVLGLSGDPDRTIREKMEQHMAGDLKALGYDAVTSIDEYGPKAFEDMKEAEALEELYKKGIEAVVTIVLLAKEKERYYISPGKHIAGTNTRFWEYYSTVHDRIYAPGYYTTDTRYFWESNFYDLYQWKLLYSVQSQSFQPASTNSLAHEYGEMIVKDMVKMNVLQQQKPFKAF